MQPASLLIPCLSLIDRSREHVQTVQYFLDQRRQIDHFLEDKQSVRRNAS